VPVTLPEPSVMPVVEPRPSVRKYSCDVPLVFEIRAALRSPRRQQISDSHGQHRHPYGPADPLDAILGYIVPM